MTADFIEFVRSLYGTKEFIPLHAPVFNGNEKQFVNEAIDSTFISSVSDYVLKFEQMLCDFTGATYAIPIVNGTAGLHLALHVAGVDKDCEVLTQSLTFVATCNAIAYTGAQPILIDIDKNTLGLSPDSLVEFLQEHAQIKDDGCAYNKTTGKRIAACIPMHTFGHPARIQELLKICQEWSIDLIEDAAEALGSYVVSGAQKQHCGLFGKMGVLSFNGNKIITTGAGGAIITNDEELAFKLRHLSTTAKKPHAWEYTHDEIGFNYRMPGLNASLGCAQLEQLPVFLADKRKITIAYQTWSKAAGVEFLIEPENTQANYWLNCLLLDDKLQRDEFLKVTNESQVMTRPAWHPMHLSAQFKNYQHVDMSVTESLVDRLVSVPSSPRVM